jgi:hypothetical protein
MSAEKKSTAELIREAIYSFSAEELPNVAARQVIGLLRDRGVEITNTVRSSTSKLLGEARLCKTARADKPSKSQLIQDKPKRKRKNRRSLDVLLKLLHRAEQFSLLLPLPPSR